MTLILLAVAIGLGLFFLAFVGLNKFFPTIIGLASVLGILAGLYFIWLGFVGNSENRFIWGCFFLLAGGGVLVYLKSAFSD
jgi:hypothetical protein